MRRVLAVAMLGAALFAAAACGSNNNDNDGGDDAGTPTTSSPTPGGGGSTDETCAAIEDELATFQTELVTGGAELSTAVASGDEAAVQEAAASLIGIAGETSGRLRDIAAGSEDPELRTAVEDVATEVENLADAFANDPSSPESLDTTAFEEAAGAVQEQCGT